ncbi:MAG: LON peptidase substrate-binding domain-containing protein [Acidimicrobiales bacterium]
MLLLPLRDGEQACSYEAAAFLRGSPREGCWGAYPRSVSRKLPIFPLGTVLVPHTVLPLHIFEQRYRALMHDLFGEKAKGRVASSIEATENEPTMGIVLIERGHEVGGGEQRSTLGTLASILHVEHFPDGRVLAIAVGTRRFAVVRWLPDDPYPLAETEELPSERWEPRWEEPLHIAEREVRRAAALAGEIGETAAFPSLSNDPLVASWQLCAAAPVGPFDRQRLLAANDVGRRLVLLAEQAREAASLLTFRLGQS